MDDKLKQHVITFLSAARFPKVVDQDFSHRHITKEEEKAEEERLEKEKREIQAWTAESEKHNSEESKEAV